MPSRFLEADTLRRLDSFEYAPRQLVEGYLAGRHPARSRGSSTEFRELRPYSVGDDPRQVDWRVYARTDRHYLRTFEQETNTACYLLLDMSASMRFGDDHPRHPGKFEYAAFFAAALAYLVTRGGDQVGLTLFDDQMRQHLPLGATGRHLQGVLNLLDEAAPSGRTRTAEVLRGLEALLPRRGALVVLSDFLDEVPDLLAALNPYLHRGFDITLIHLIHPAEADLAPRGLTAFTDLETGERVVAHADRIRSAYAAAFAEQADRIQRMAVRKRMLHLRARTDRHYFELFDSFVR